LRTFTKVLASSVFFGSSSQAISTSATFGQLVTSSAGQTFSKSLFGNPGVFGGPQFINYTRGFSVQANFGGNGVPSSGSYGGTLNLLVSNVNEKPMFVVAASALVASTGSVMFNSTFANFEWVDFQFIPSNTSTSGFVSVIVTGKSGLG
jgi:hypothetical protein